MKRFLHITLVGVQCVLCSFLQASVAVASELKTTANVPTEIVFESDREYADPFNEVTLDVLFTAPDGNLRRVPAFWAGGKKWQVRYASSQTGTHGYRSACSDQKNVGLHGVSGNVVINEYRGDNPLFVHGPIHVAADKRHFEHADGTPFFWLGDTWWMGLCHRLHWPDEFQQLAADRKQKGFNVIQIVAGLYPDMSPFDPRGANEAGFPWEKDYARIRPEYFDAVDQRLGYLVEQGFTPCIVGAWGYFEKFMGVEKAKQHWRYLVARYGASPVVWCVAGEANLPYYLEKGFPYDDRAQVKGWTEVTRYLRQTDPFHRPITIHPTGIGRLSSRNAIDDVSLLDFDMLQTPHGQGGAVMPTIETMRESFTDTPTMPVINGEAAYEKLGDSLPTEWTRSMFWLCMMNGAAGHTYGANGIWQVNRKGEPHGPSPHHAPGSSGYGTIPWEDAMKLPGSSQMAIGKRFFESLPWTELVPLHGSAEWLDAAAALADWIWFPEGDPKRNAPVETRFFRRSFELTDSGPVQSAMISIAADDQFVVWLNGKELGKGAAWGNPERLDATALITPGKNLLAVAATNCAAPVELNPAGLNARLEIRYADGGRQVVGTDAAWRVSKSDATGWREPGYDDSAWSKALVTAKLGELPWGNNGGAPTRVPPQACGVGDKLLIIYALGSGEILVKGLQPQTSYRATLIDPTMGGRTPLKEIAIDEGGNGRVWGTTQSHDTLILLELR